MACSVGCSHTVTLSDDGSLYSFGCDTNGELGLFGTNYNPVVPNLISTLPKIKQICCGGNFTVCIDEEGFMWSGQNNYGQLGTGNICVAYKIPQKIENIPLAQSISCGSAHTLIITNDGNLWAVGRNDLGQLFLNNDHSYITIQKTSLSNISYICAGSVFSFCQNYGGEIFACGFNGFGQLSLGHNNHQIKFCKISNQLSNIYQISCGFHHTFFLDVSGNVFSVGKNAQGTLGLGHNIDMNISHQIRNIPPIQTISCSGYSSYLLDIDGNVWECGVCAHNSNVPIKINSLVDIKQISRGYGASHFLAKDSEGKIFSREKNSCGHLGIGSNSENKSPKVMNSNYFSIWGTLHLKSKAKSARK